MWCRRPTTLRRSTPRRAARRRPAPTSAAFLLAFNTIGWEAQNVLFNTVDALLGDPLISDALGNQQPARVRSVPAEHARGRGRGGHGHGRQRGADQRPGQQRRHVGAHRVLWRGGDERQRVLSSNMVNSTARAYIDYTPATCTPSRRRSTCRPHGRADVTARGPGSGSTRARGPRCTPRSRRPTTAGAGIGLNHLASTTLLDEYQYTSLVGITLTGLRGVRHGQAPGGRRRMPSTTTTDVARQGVPVHGHRPGADLGAQDYTDFELWKRLTRPTDHRSTTFTVATIGAGSARGSARTA
jgi:hypothetical protein